jgi:predicted anti-sigma-YlaC factor YlaD
VQALRGETYRAELGHLTDEAWEHAVRECLRCEDWFPTIATVLRYADEYQPPAQYLPPHRRTEEEKAEAREIAKRGLEQIRAVMQARGLDVDPVKDMP